MTHDHDSRSLAQLSTSVDDAQQAFWCVAYAAFSRLEVLDPELAAALVDLFEKRPAAARYFASVQFDDENNGYATLVAGKRDRILELIDRVKRGIF